MSNIYIQEPPTNGKVLLETTVGDIDIELWSKEVPLACRNFVQLCMEGYYNNTIFHRVVKGFMAQGGDPTGTGTGGESAFGKPFKDEFHSRLRFVRRGLVAMASSGKDTNESQFFFTLGACPDLQNKHTIFGKVTGNTIYNMIRLEEGPVDRNERPLYPHKITATKILSNPFPDIVPRSKEIAEEPSGQEKKRPKGTKNFKLLSFGDEAEEEEQETEELVKEWKGRSKSRHDLTQDPTLSTQPAVEEVEDSELGGGGALERIKEKLSKSKAKDKAPAPLVPDKKAAATDKDDDDDDEKEDGEEEEEQDPASLQEEPQVIVPGNDDDDDDDDNRRAQQDEEEEEVYLTPSERRQKNMEAIKLEIKELTKELKRKKEDSLKDEPKNKKSKESAVDNEVLQEFHKDMEAFKASKLSKQEREKKTLEKLEQFKARLHSSEDSWMKHALKAEEDEAPLVLAHDASIRTADSYELSDPRNPLNQRRRGEDKPQESSSSSHKDKHRSRSSHHHRHHDHHKR